MYFLAIATNIPQRVKTAFVAILWLLILHSRFVVKNGYAVLIGPHST